MIFSNTLHVFSFPFLGQNCLVRFALEAMFLKYMWLTQCNRLNIVWYIFSTWLLHMQIHIHLLYTYTGNIRNVRGRYLDSYRHQKILIYTCILCRTLNTCCPMDYIKSTCIPIFSIASSSIIHLSTPGYIQKNIATNTATKVKLKYQSVNKDLMGQKIIPQRRC